MTLLEFVDRHIVGVGCFAFFTLAGVVAVALFGLWVWGNKPTIGK